MNKKIRLLAFLLVLAGCLSRMRARSGTPPEFPFPVSLPSSVTTIGAVTHDSNGEYAFRSKDSTTIVRGEKWSGHVRVDGFSSHDASFLATLENSLAHQTGWAPVYRDETRNPPIATLHRSLGGEHLWISLEGWPENVTVTMVHRK